MLTYIFGPPGTSSAWSRPADNDFVFSDERIEIDMARGGSVNPSIGKGQRESVLKERVKRAADPTIERNVYDSISRLDRLPFP